ncbi:hypothetical protein SAY87_000111 [Trapa incisa]|uniref:Laccase n=1 Tax=Trapa incisa TaxID=236973 RepID=A0AAN7GG67_9MYRT|nr:hypothetical protein SAY87_000111 [Trapa incisa]
MGTGHGMLFAVIGLVVLHGWSLFPALATLHYYNFVLKEANFTKLCSTKSMLTVNGSFPGPEIRVHKGDTAFVTVHNNGTYGVTIHCLPSIANKSAAGNFTNLLRSLASKDHPVNVPLNITKRVFMAVSVNQDPCPATAPCGGPNNNSLTASMNNISFASPSIDILQAYYGQLTKKNAYLKRVYNTTFPDKPPYMFNFTGDVGNNTLYPSHGTDVKMIKYGAAVEIIWQGTNIGAAENHPMHLHGYNFYVVGMGDGNFDKKTSPSTYNLVDPPLVNTIGIPKKGWATIRFFANNPGVWFMHCHLERHASWGMATVLIVENGRTEDERILPPPGGMPACSKP